MNLTKLAAFAAGFTGVTLALWAAPVEDGFTALCNGRDLTGWDGNPDLWSVKDGAIMGKTTDANPIKVNTFLIWTNGVTTDFELRCSFRITANNDKNFANSGIQYRSKVLDPKQWIVGGYQADMEAGESYTGILYDERGVAGGRGIMAARGEKVVWDSDGKKQVTASLGKSEEIQATIKKADWNDYVVIVKGNHFQHFINGHATVDVTDECASKFVNSGVLALQLHVGGAMTVEFKDLRIKKLEGGSAGNDLDLMQGTWKVASLESGGERLPDSESAGITVKIEKSKYWLTRDGNTDEGAFTLDLTKSPRQMDIRPATGDGSGALISAIYEINGDVFRVCYHPEDGGSRPTAFKSAADSSQILVTYKRK